VAALASSNHPLTAIHGIVGKSVLAVARILLTRFEPSVQETMSREPASLPIFTITPCWIAKAWTTESFLSTVKM